MRELASNICHQARRRRTTHTDGVGLVDFRDQLAVICKASLSRNVVEVAQSAIWWRYYVEAGLAVANTFDKGDFC